MSDARVTKPSIIFRHLSIEQRAAIATWMHSLPPDVQNKAMELLMEADKLAEAFATKMAELEALGLTVRH